MEIIKTEDENIVIERTVTDKEINISLVREDLDGHITLLNEQNAIKARLEDKLINIDDEEIAQIITDKIEVIDENIRWNLIDINNLSEKLK